MRWRADLRNKRFTAEEMGAWQHRCVHCEVSFPCKSGLTRHANECRKEESERRVVAVTGLCAAICSVKDGGPRAPVFCWLGRCLPLLSCVFGALCGCRLDCLRFPVALVVGRTLRALQLSVQVGFQRRSVPVM